MERPSTMPTITHLFNSNGFGNIQQGFGFSSGENQHGGGGVCMRFVLGNPSPSKGDHANDNSLTNKVGKIFQKAGDLADRLVRILREAYVTHEEARFQACINTGDFGRGECDEWARSGR